MSGEVEMGDAPDHGEHHAHHTEHDGSSSASSSAAGSSVGGGDHQLQASLPEQAIIDLEEQRRRAAVGNMERIEKEFSTLKGQFYDQKLAALDAEIRQLEEGTHEGYLTALTTLQQSRQRKEWQARKWLELQQQSIAILFDAEMRQAEDEYNSEMSQLKSQLRDQFVDQRRKLEEDRSNMTLHSEETERVATRTRTLRKRGASSSTNAAGPHGDEENFQEPFGNGDVFLGRTISSDAAAAAIQSVHGEGLSAADAAAARRVQVPPPHIQYMLHDDEIDHDLRVIQAAAAAAYTHPSSAEVDMIPSGQNNGLEEHSVMVLNDELHVDQTQFEKGSRVVVTAVVGGQRHSGTLHGVTAAEVFVQEPPVQGGALLRFTLDSLRTGANVIHRA